MLNAMAFLLNGPSRWERQTWKANPAELLNNPLCSFPGVFCPHLYAAGPSGLSQNVVIRRKLP